MARQVSRSEFAGILKNLKDENKWYFIRPIIQFEVTGLNTGTSLDLFEYKESDKLLYVAIKYHKFEKTMLIMNTNYEDGVFDYKAGKELLPLIFEKIKNEPVFETVMSTALNNQMLIYFAEDKKSHPYVPMNEPTFANIVSRENEKMLFDRELNLPSGYETRSLKPHHAKQMIELLQHAQDGDDDQAAIRIGEMPSVGIYEKATGKLVAFEYNDGIGSIAHQYVYPDHRGKGLGKATEILICRKNLQELGIRPTKCVALKRPKVRAITEKTGYWSHCLNARKEKTFTWWTLYSKNPQKPILVFDN